MAVAMGVCVAFLACWTSWRRTQWERQDWREDALSASPSRAPASLCQLCARWRSARQRQRQADCPRASSRMARAQQLSVLSFSRPCHASPCAQWRVAPLSSCLCARVVVAPLLLAEAGHARARERTEGNEQGTALQTGERGTREAKLSGEPTALERKQTGAAAAAAESGQRRGKRATKNTGAQHTWDDRSCVVPLSDASLDQRLGVEWRRRGCIFM